MLHWWCDTKKDVTTLKVMGSFVLVWRPHTLGAACYTHCTKCKLAWSLFKLITNSTQQSELSLFFFIYFENYIHKAFWQWSKCVMSWFVGIGMLMWLWHFRHCDVLNPLPCLSVKKKVLHNEIWFGVSVLNFEVRVWRVKPCIWVSLQCNFAPHLVLFVCCLSW